MKRKYNTPHTEIVNLNARQSILAGSGFGGMVGAPRRGDDYYEWDEVNE